MLARAPTCEANDGQPALRLARGQRGWLTFARLTGALSSLGVPSSFSAPATSSAGLCNLLPPESLCSAALSRFVALPEVTEVEEAAGAHAS